MMLQFHVKAVWLPPCGDDGMDGGWSSIKRGGRWFCPWAIEQISQHDVYDGALLKLRCGDIFVVQGTMNDVAAQVTSARRS